MRKDYEFLAGGGEMGARMRAFDWSQTPIGPIESWPQSLRSPLSMLLPSKAQIILFWGPEYVVLYNDAYRPVFGAKHPGALGQPGGVAWKDFWDTDVNLHSLLDGVVRTGEAFTAEDLRFITERHGYTEEAYFNVSYDPVRNESGAVGGVYCIVAETTRRVVGERRMALLKDLAARNAASRTVRDACATALETLATRPQDVAFALARAGSELQACTPGAEAALAAAKPEQVKTLPIDSKGGTLVLGLNALRPFDDQYRSFVDLVAGQVATGIANAQAYEEEKKRAEALAEIDRAKTAFFSNVSHEFRTPLTLMLGPLEEILSRHGSEGSPDRDALEVTYRNAQRLLKLVNTLLDFSRIEAGRAQAVYAPADLASLTTDLASNFRSACERAGLRLVIDCVTNEPAYVDREMWEKIVLNLLSNAFKFTFEGEIAVHLRETQDGFRLAVRDTGGGIPAAELPRMFERFHRVEGARGRSYEGSGIGLALVQELVKLHGGSIEVESTPGAGTVFTVLIHKGKAHLPAERIRAERAALSTALRASAYVDEALSWLPGQQPKKEKSVSGPRVLLADDNADLRDYVRGLLAEYYDVETVADGEAALAAIRARAPDLVLADVMMPRLDGFGLLAAIRSDDATRGIPVVLLSARAGEEARIEGLTVGADDYIVKPFAARELLGKIAARLELRGAAARDAFRLTLADALRPLSEPAAIKAHASRLLAERLRAERVAYFEVRDAAYFVESDFTRDVPSVAGTYPVDSFGPALLAAYQAGHTAVCADVEAEPTLSDEEKAAYRGIQIGAYVGVPLVKEGRFVAGLAVHCAARRVWLPADVAMAEECAERTWAAVERAHAEEALRSSEERHRAVVESQIDMVCRFRLDGTILFVNEAYARARGTTASALEGGNFWDYVPQSEHDHVRAMLGRMTPQAPEVRIENRFGTAEGERWTLWTNRALAFDAAGKAIEAQSTGVDITERRRAELALRESEERFRALAAMSSDWYWEQDEHFRYVQLSDEVEARTGMRATSIIGKTRWDLPHTGVSEGQWAEHRALLERHEPFRNFEYRRLNEHGDVVWTSASGDPIFDAGGRFQGYRGTGTNITARKQGEEALRDADQRKDEFIATLSHELRNPLAPLRNALELLRMQGANGALAPIREMMERQVNQLVRLVDDLLEMSRVSRGALELRNERVELAAVVTNALETSDPLIKGARHELSVSLPEKPIWIEGDPVRLAQIVANLLNNAATYTPPGGRIQVRAEENDGTAKVSVADNGDGIADDLLPGLFQIFSRGKQAGRNVGGLGIGLAISRKLAEMHGGKLSVTSEGPGKGSEFTLRLPLAANAGTAKTRTEPVFTAGVRQQRILVVDDNRDAAESMRMILSFLGADVQVANDGPQALDAFEAYRPEVVVLDIGMPGMDGYEVARVIRERHPGRHTAIVALTGWGRPDDRRKSREAGFDHHLVKPADIGALRTLLASLK